MAEGPRVLTLTFRDFCKDKHQALFDQFYDDVCRKGFDPDELEDKCVWQTSLEVEDEIIEWHLTMVLLPQEQQKPERVVAGAVYEYYKRANVGLLAYLTTAPDQRGKGHAKRLLQAVAERLGLCAAACGRGSCEGLFIEVHAAEGNENDTMDPRERQQLYSKLGFRPLGFEFHSIGRYNKWKFNIAVLVASVPPNSFAVTDAQTDGMFPTKPLLEWAEDFYRAVLIDEEAAGRTDGSEWEGLRRMQADLSGVAAVPFGNHLWK
eukprot:TRINITY_DN27865_c0_g1_i1.p1 TRINITY_DN27865_c0_g1~~TRINITY_DN27865_c0_g1_i1.p1  ORF type:complete len:263 (+),score=55.75 TRINITY_DN27865_c0_g1_i1:375-1163(+)